MRLTEFRKGAAALLLAAASAAAQDGVLGDLAARVEYGFYSDDPAIVVAAWTALGRLPGDDVAVRQQRALTALRMAQLTAARGGELDAWIRDCLEHADHAAGDRRGAAAGSVEAEGAILTAACSLIAARGAAIKNPLQQRRVDQALERARTLDPNNPRLGLLAAWSLSAVPAAESAPVREAVEAQLARAVEAFDARASKQGDAGWGRAEALAQLGELRLLRGEVRDARDLIERALFAAPDYRFAAQLRERLQAGH